MAPMDDQRNSSSPEMGFAGYGAYNVNRQEFPSGISLPFPPQFAAHEPRCLTPAVPIFAGRFTSIRRSSQSSVDDPRPFLRPRDQPSQNDYEMTYQQEEFPEEESPEPSLEQGIPTDPMENTSEFVKMLFKFVSSFTFDIFAFNPRASALEDPIFQSVMCWSLLGDCFMIKVCPLFCVVMTIRKLYMSLKDVEKFTKTLLPRLYNHSNFAGFVRQLKKYDFHKVDKAEDNDGYQVCHRRLDVVLDLPTPFRIGVSGIRTFMPTNLKISKMSSASPPFIKEVAMPKHRRGPFRRLIITPAIRLPHLFVRLSHPIPLQAHICKALILIPVPTTTAVFTNTKWVLAPDRLHERNCTPKSKVLSKKLKIPR